MRNERSMASRRRSTGAQGAHWPVEHQENAQEDVEESTYDRTARRAAGCTCGRGALSPAGASDILAWKLRTGRLRMCGSGPCARCTYGVSVPPSRPQLPPFHTGRWAPSPAVHDPGSHHVQMNQLSTPVLWRRALRSHAFAPTRASYPIERASLRLRYSESAAKTRAARRSSSSAPVLPVPPQHENPTTHRHVGALL